MKSLPYLCLLLLFCSTCKKDTELQFRQAAEERLQYLLRHQQEWIKVHAAEFLIDLGKPEGINTVFKKEQELYGTKSPYRIGIWRVLSQVDTSASAPWEQMMIKVAADTLASDQLHAIESIAKRGITTSWMTKDISTYIFNNKRSKHRLKSYTRWALAASEQSKDGPHQEVFRKMLSAELPEVRRIAAYGLRKLKYYPKKYLHVLPEIALSEPESSKARPYLLSLAMIVHPDQNSQEYLDLEKVFLKYATDSAKSNRYAFCETLAEVGTEKHLSILKDLLLMTNPIISIETLESPQEHPWNIDVSGAAAYAILRILDRHS